MEDHLILRDDKLVEVEEEEPLIPSVECRICQEEDSIKNLEVPCACNGSLKFAHRKCVQRWCNEKRDLICEICHQSYKSGYTSAPTPPSEDTVIDISGNWTLAGEPVNHLLERDHDEYEDNSTSGASFCRSAAIILMALLLLRHALTIGDGDSDDDDPSAFFALFVLRAAGFLLPCYIMIWAVSMLQRHRQTQEAETMFMIQARQQSGLHVTIAPAMSASTPAVIPGPTHEPLH